MIIAGIASVALLAGCASSAGSTDSAESGGGEGFEFGAPQEKVSELVADLEPVTLTYQTTTTSQNSSSRHHTLAVKEAIEERSDGKIEIEVVWGNAIASNTETEDALVDGRLDISNAAPVYEPDIHPKPDAINQLTQYIQSSPLVGEAVAAAVVAELAWTDEELLSEFTDNGLTPFFPMRNMGEYYVLCTEPMDDPEDWKGKQVRIAGGAQGDIIAALGASPVSMEFGEVYEALQRNLVNCAFVQTMVAEEFGLSEVAPYIHHLSEGRSSNTAPGATILGSSYRNLPLAYQQIIFDTLVDHLHGEMEIIASTAASAVNEAKAAGGDVVAFDSESESAILDTQHQLVEDYISEGLLEANVEDEVEQLSDKWSGIVDELGYTDGGDLSEMNEWYQPDQLDFRPLGERLMEDVIISHRPS